MVYLNGSGCTELIIQLGRVGHDMGESGREQDALADMGRLVGSNSELDLRTVLVDRRCRGNLGGGPCCRSGQR